MLKSKAKSRKTADPEAPVLSLKERLIQKRKAERARQELIRFTIAAIFVSIIAGLTIGLLGSPAVGGGVAITILCTTLSFKYPRQAIIAFLIYMPFGGTITYAIGATNPLLQLAKDAFYIPGLIGVIQYCRREKLPILIPKALVAPLGILLGYCLLTLLFVNGSQQLTADAEKPIAMGILGLKVLLGYIPLITCAYYLIRDKKDLDFLMRLHIILILVCCGLAFLQYFMLQTGICEGTRNYEGAALFKASTEARCLVGGSLLYSPQHGQIRLPGTFVAPWQWGWFLISAGFLAYASAFSDPSPFWRLLGLSSMASVFVMSVLSGQRIALALVPITFAILLFLTGQVANLKRFIPIGIGLAMILGIAMVSNPEIVQQRFDSFEERWNASPPHAFIERQFNWSLDQQEGFLGRGLGRATNSARSLGETELIETYYPKLIYEIGPLGAILFLVAVTVLTFQVFKAYRSVKDPNLRSYGASFWVFVLFMSYNTYYYPLDVDPVAVYYWFFAGAALKLPELDRQGKQKKEPEQKKSRKRSKGFS